MSNPYFKFKQFTIWHDKCAMKVGTDGVLLGTWTCADDQTKKILDIGTGSGLIALILAQRNIFAQIDAIEIDASAVQQAIDNIKKSPFHDRIKCYEVALQEYAMEAKGRYDLIVSNPPFFDNSLKSGNKSRTLARHTDTLPMDDLIRISSRLVSEEGRISLVYPFECKEKLLLCGEQNSLHAIRICNVYPTPNSLPKRVLIELTRNRKNLVEEDLIIEKERHVYTDQFKNLAKDFYLHL